MKWVLVGLLVVQSLQVSEGPKLNEVQRLQFQNLAQRLEIAQLKAQAAERDFEKAKDEMTRLIQSVQVEGYEFDVSTLTYRQKPKEKEKK